MCLLTSGPFTYLHDFPANLNEAIGVLLVPDHQRHPRIALEVAKLMAVKFGV